MSGSPDSASAVASLPRETQLGKVAVFMQDFAGGGAERVMLSLVAGMLECGHDVDLLVFRKDGPYLSDVPPSARIIDLQAGMPKSLPAVIRYLREERPRAVLSALNQPNVVAAWARRLSGTGVRTVITVHNTLSIEARNGKSLRLKMMPHFVRAFYPWADAIVTVSKGVADDMRQNVGVRGRHVEVIYNPVVSESMLEKAKAPVDHPWFAPGQPPVVLSVGRLTGQKDFSTLIRAFALVRPHVDARLMILGQGEERAALEAEVASLGLDDCVSLPGFVDNPYAYMANCAAFVLSSRYEGLPTVLIEALAAGARVVSTDCPSGPNEILAGGKYGRLVPVEDPDALSTTIRATLAEPRTSASDESWRLYERRAVVEQYRRVLGIDANP